MMPDLGKYAAEVQGAYIATIVILVLLVAVSWMRSRALRRALDAAEAGRANG